MFLPLFILTTAYGNERTMLLFYKGYGSHLDLSMIKLTVQNNITILKLPLYKDSRYE